MAVDFQRGVDAGFRHYGVAATFTPAGGAGVAVTVILRKPETEASFQTAGYRLAAAGQAAALTADIRRTEVAAPAKGDGLTVGGVGYLVVDTPDLDSERLVWTLPLRKA